MPVPLCECEYCRASNHRLRPSLLVGTPGTTRVFDIGPDLRTQLAETDTTAVDAFFLTHFHRDHADGLVDLMQATRSRGSNATVDDRSEDGPTHPCGLYMTETAVDHLRETFACHLDVLSPTQLTTGDAISIGDVRVSAFAVDHWRPEWATRGYTASSPDATVGYAPDMRRFLDGPPPVEFDLLVCEGGGLSDNPNHGPPSDLGTAIEAAPADRVVLVNATEHGVRMHTVDVATEAAGEGCELGTDFRSYSL